MIRFSKPGDPELPIHVTEFRLNAYSPSGRRMQAPQLVNAYLM
jgi:hypothetical protein